MAEAKKSNKERVSRHAINKTLISKRKEHKAHSPRFLTEAQKLDGKTVQPLGEAIQSIKDTSSTKFDSSVELHLHLSAKKGKKGAEDEYARGILHLPHGLGKTVTVIILNEDMIESIAKTQKLDFDVALATPALMPKLGKVAKILGTKGKMPNPKAGTVTDKPEEVLADIRAGRVEYRQDAGRNIHQMIGKASWDNQKLVENAEAVINAFTRNRVESVTIASTMGPSVKINLDA